MDNQSLINLLINPFFCLRQIHPMFTEDHEPLVSEDDWISANKRLIKELGSETYLRALLATLKGEVRHQ